MFPSTMGHLAKLLRSGYLVWDLAMNGLKSGFGARSTSDDYNTCVVCLERECSVVATGGWHGFWDKRKQVF